MDIPGDDNVSANNSQNNDETESVNKKSVAKDYNSIHNDSAKHRQRTLTQTSDRTIIHVNDQKNRIKGVSQCPDLFTRETLYAKVPITQWLPKYDVSCLISDAIAGITVGLTVIPQGIAYAGVAELPAQVINLLKIFT